MSAHASMSKRASVVVAVVALLVGLLPAPSVRAEAGPASATPPDPVAVVTMGCGSGQVDINSASTAELQRTLNLGKPVARRLVASRPFLRVAPDLLVVSGIGPTELDAIVADGRACAAPPTLPPPSFDVCVGGDGKIDVNRPESEESLAAMFGRPTAERIVENLPYWRLDLMKAELAGGASGPKIDKNRSKLCVTPPTIDFDDTRWGWIDPNVGGIVEKDDAWGGYRLTVPGDVVEEGSWGSIMPTEAPEDLESPAADFHIHGTWDGLVQVTLPIDPIPGVDPDTWTDTLVSLPEGGTFNDATVFAHGAVTTTATSISAELDSLSTKFSLGVPAKLLSPNRLNPLVTTPTNAAVSQLVRNFLGNGATRPTCDPELSEGVAQDGRRIETRGEPVSNLPGYTTPTLWRCIVDNDGLTETWRFATNRSAAFVVREGGGNVDITSVTGGGGLLALAATSVWNQAAVDDGVGGKQPIAVTASTIQANVAPIGGSFAFDYNLGANLLFQALDNSSDLIPSGVASAVYDILVDCPTALTTWGLDYQSGVEAADATVALVGALAKCITDQLGESSDVMTQIGGSSEMLRKAKKAVAFLRAADVGNRFFDAIEAGLADDPTVAMVNVEGPPDNSGPTNGGGSPIPGGGWDGTLPPATDITNAIVHLPGYHNELTLNGDRVGRAILDQGEYICLADKYPLRDWMFQDQYSQAISQNAAEPISCNRNVEDLHLPAGSRNWILREGSGTAWLLDSSGHVRWIEDEATYICLAQQYWVLDWREWDEITAFPWAPDGQHATC